MKKILAVCASLVITTTPSLPGFASDLADWERFAINIGAFVSIRDTEIRLDATNGTLGTELDLADDLGLDDSQTVARMDGFWRSRLGTCVIINQQRSPALQKENVGNS